MESALLGGERRSSAGKRDDERRAATEFAFHFDRAAVFFDDRARNGQAQARAARRAFAVATFVAAIEPFEHVRQVVRRNADARVTDPQHDAPLAARRFDVDPHAAAGRRELDRVVEQIVDHLPQPAGVADDRRTARECRPPARCRALRRRRETSRRCFDEAIELQRLVEPHIAAAVALGQQQQLIDERRQLLTLVGNDDQQRLVLFGRTRSGVERDVDRTANGGQRRTEFVRRIGDELALLRQVVGDAIEKVIDRERKLIEFVAGAANRQPFVEVRSVAIARRFA